MYAEIVLNIPLERKFHYYIPEALRGDVAIGKRVLVNLLAVYQRPVEAAEVVEESRVAGQDG